MGMLIIGLSLNYCLFVFGFFNGKEVVDVGIVNIGFCD